MGGGDELRGGPAVVVVVDVTTLGERIGTTSGGLTARYTARMATTTMPAPSAAQRTRCRPLEIGDVDISLGHQESPATPTADPPERLLRVLSRNQAGAGMTPAPHRGVRAGVIIRLFLITDGAALDVARRAFAQQHREFAVPVAEDGGQFGAALRVGADSPAHLVAVRLRNGDRLA